MGFRTNGPSDQLDLGPMPMDRRTNGLSDHRHGTTMSITPAEARRACRKQTRCYAYVEDGHEAEAARCGDSWFVVRRH